MEYVYAFLVGYAAGCFNLAYLLSVSRGTSIKDVGNGNPGASNVTMHFGVKAGVCVALCDILKALLPALLLTHFFPSFQYMAVVTGCGAVIGHMFPPYMNFRGGKGFASYIGMSIAVDWKVTLIVLALAVFLALLLDYIVIATFTVTTVTPFMILLFWNCSPAGFYTLCCMYCVTAIILIKHIPNSKKIVANTEPHISDIWKKPVNK